MHVWFKRFPLFTLHPPLKSSVSFNSRWYWSMYNVIHTYKKWTRRAITIELVSKNDADSIAGSREYLVWSMHGEGMEVPQLPNTPVFNSRGSESWSCIGHCRVIHNHEIHNVIMVSHWCPHFGNNWLRLDQFPGLPKRIMTSSSVNTKIKLAGAFLLDAPPGEFNDVTE